MNIQLPVVLWTVICFLLLMVILKNLLFKPVFAVMDQRKEKLKQAEEKKAEIKRLADEHEARLFILSEDARIQKENFIKSELELIHVSNKQDIEAAKASRLERVEEYKKATEKEKEEIVTRFMASEDAIVRAFADRLISE